MGEASEIRVRGLGSAQPGCVALQVPGRFCQGKGRRSAWTSRDTAPPLRRGGFPGSLVAPRPPPPQPPTFPWGCRGKPLLLEADPDRSHPLCHRVTVVTSTGHSHPRVLQLLPPPAQEWGSFPGGSPGVLRSPGRDLKSIFWARCPGEPLASPWGWDVWHQI